MNRIPLWIDLRGVPVNKRLSYFKAVADAKSEAMLLELGDPHAGKAGLPVVAVGADGQLRRQGKRIGRLVNVRDKASQDLAGKAKGIVIADGNDWRVIPLENLIAARQSKPGTLYALARGAEQAALFATTLETGVHGIVLAPSSPTDIQATDLLLRKNDQKLATPTLAAAIPSTSKGQNPSAGPRDPKEKLDFVVAAVTEISDAGLGDRVCVDTTSLLRNGEGLLVGSTARSMVLVHAETTKSDILDARPFRVNAGALHMYTLAPGATTRYLSELSAGGKVVVVSHTGSHRVATIGRCKVERRPHTLVRWTAEDMPGSAVLQTAETVCLLRPDGARVAITSLKVGDHILVHPEAAARHAGMAIDAALEER